MAKPLLYDTYCGAGGASKGYMDAGFRVIGIDNRPQPRYCGDGFIQMDALEFLERLARGEYEQPDAIHASPPCQDYSLHLRGLVTSGRYPRMITDIQRLVEGRLYVIENVIGSPIPRQATLMGENGCMLCGTMFGLRNIQRHRFFLTSIPIILPRQLCSHREPAMNPYDADARERDGIRQGAMQHFGRAMGIDWMKGKEVSEAIPPAYTLHLGTQLLQYLEHDA